MFLHCDSIPLNLGCWVFQDINSWDIPFNKSIHNLLIKGNLYDRFKISESVISTKGTF